MFFFSTQVLVSPYIPKRGRDNLSLRKIILEDDALQVVNVVKSTGQNWSIHGQIVDDTHGILNLMHM
jgi:hypothetical protein